MLRDLSAALIGAAAAHVATPPETPFTTLVSPPHCTEGCRVYQSVPDPLPENVTITITAPSPDWNRHGKCICSPSCTEDPEADNCQAAFVYNISIADPVEGGNYTAIKTHNGYCYDNNPGSSHGNSTSSAFPLYATACDLEVVARLYYEVSPTAKCNFTTTSSTAFIELKMGCSACDGSCP